MPRDISAAFRNLIDKLAYNQAEGSQPNFRLDVTKRNPESGTREGELVTDNVVTDNKPSLIMSSTTNKFYAVYIKGSYIYGVTGEEDENGNIVWGDESQLFEGDEPDLEFYGTFTVQGSYNTGDIMIVYERSGTIYFRKADIETDGWQGVIDATERTVKSGSDPSIVRAWADPPGIGDTDLGIYVFYIDSGDLKFTYSTDLGVSWEDSVEIDKPAGGTKGNPKAFRESSYRLACVYEYDDGSKIDVYYILSQDASGGTEFVNIASPDETFKMAAMCLSVTEFDLLDYSEPDETYKMTAENLTKTEYDSYIAGYEDEGEDCEVPDEIFKIQAENLNMQLYEGEEP